MARRRCSRRCGTPTWCARADGARPRSSTSTCTWCTRSPRRRPSTACASAGRRVRRPDRTSPPWTTTSRPSAREAGDHRPALGAPQIAALERELRRVRHPALLAAARAPGHRARDRPGAGRHAAGHDHRLRRQPHLARTAPSARSPSASAPARSSTSWPRRRLLPRRRRGPCASTSSGELGARRHGQGPDPRHSSAQSASPAPPGHVIEYARRRHPRARRWRSA